MTLNIDPQKLVFSEFDCLEPPETRWLEERAYWEDYNRMFFQSNGLPYSSADSRVDEWLTATDRAPFAFMARELLQQLGERTDLSDVDLVLLAHWLPDLHLGTSVTNFAMQHLGIDKGFGFAISDRGLSAPLFAMNCAARYLNADRRKAIIMVMDQKHLLYRSPIVDDLKPVNSATIMVLENDTTSGLTYAGYRRIPSVKKQDLGAAIQLLCEQFKLRPDKVTLIADPEVILKVAHAGPTLSQNTQHLCSAPFAALAQTSDTYEDVLIVSYEDERLSAVCLKAPDERAVG
ncbi:hypothetical protein PsW64_02603 [Pseudovibrio sp. W64]|uniref:hypothetical protein n=1 Tax=Pseudovibrio TaxID=258255 RepID=UPI0007AE7296|nr:hypothetical protein [Pseudovibrio sp. W64]KZK81519.1 hypothetical protein PsW64_02603 [Pseudovibrio sp. W64]